MTLPTEGSDCGKGELARPKEPVRYHPDVLRCQAFDFRRHLRQRDYPVVVEDAAGEATHPGADVVQREQGGGADLPFRTLKLFVTDSIRGEAVQLAPGQVTHLFQLLRARVGVDHEQPTLAIRARLRADAVAQPPFLPDLLEQPRAHPPARDQV